MKRPFDRSAQLASIESLEFDVLVIGGGATGLGIAVDAASRGYRTALVEAHDFAKATSSRSTKLVHGGVRYLAEWQFGLVTEALEERVGAKERVLRVRTDERDDTRGGRRDGVAERRRRRERQRAEQGRGLERRHHRD
jgi:glycerol-3-phosphate dehydrogenase